MLRRPVLAVCAVISVLVALSVAPAASAPASFDERYWPQWRGPLFNGVAPLGDPPIEWSEEHNVTWKVAIPGSGYASPVIWGEQIFLLSAVAVEDEGGQASLPTMDYTVMALNRADGSLRWSHVARSEAPHEGKQNNNSWASSSAITDGEHVFAFFGSRGLYAYDMDGTLLWEVDFGDMQIRNGFGEGATPVLHGDHLVVVWDHQGDSFIAALDKSSGEELWRQARNEPDTWATPLVVETTGGTQVITAGERRTYGYDLESGELVWEGPGLTVNPIPSPVYAEGIVYLTSGYRGNALRAVRLAEAMGEIDGSAAILWEHNEDTPYVPSPLLYGDTLYFLSSNSPILTAIDVGTGEPHYGPARLDGLQEVYSSPVGAAGRVYLVDRDGGALVIGNGPTLEVLASNALDDGFEASPAIVDDELYLRGRQYLYRIEEGAASDR